MRMPPLAPFISSLASRPGTQARRHARRRVRSPTRSRSLSAGHHARDEMLFLAQHADSPSRGRPSTRPTRPRARMEGDRLRMTTTSMACDGCRASSAGFAAALRRRSGARARPLDLFLFRATKDIGFRCFLLAIYMTPREFILKAMRAIQAYSQVGH